MEERKPQQTTKNLHHDGEGPGSEEAGVKQKYDEEQRNILAKKSIRNGWILFSIVFVLGWGAQAWCGKNIYREKPPIPDFYGADGELLFSREEILTGQQVWQSFGGQQLGSIWGHGALQAPDWSADWLHREALMSMQLRSTYDPGQTAHAGTPSFESAYVKPDKDYVNEVRENKWDSVSNKVILSKQRSLVFEELSKYYIALFIGESAYISQYVSGDDPLETVVGGAKRKTNLHELRKHYNMKQVSLHDKKRARKFTYFLFWSAWACVTDRPTGDDLPTDNDQRASYTNNWPHEPLVGNHVTAISDFWTYVSIACLIMGIGVLNWVHESSRDHDFKIEDERDPLEGIVVTDSMKSTVKWVWTVFALGAFQILMGYYMQHCSINSADVMPDWFEFPEWMMENITPTVARTWHMQTGVFFIAASFLAAGIFLGPIIGGRKEDPPLQCFLANFLYLCVLVIVVGSYLGELAAVHQWFDSLTLSFWFGHQGYEYVDLGRFWQIFVVVGLALWLFLVAHAVFPAFISKSPASDPASGIWHLTLLITFSAILIGSLYCSGLMYGARTHLTVMEYWRWWVVHIWVEGIFEVFATTLIAYLFVRLKVLDPAQGASTALFSASVFMASGLPGMFHHLYFSGITVPVLAIGAVFSAMEVVPLTLMGSEVAHFLKLSEAKWMKKYRPIVNCFISVSFWNFFGAGVLGFLINPPTALYFMQGTYLTAAHGHGALWGVYGVLSMGLCLLILRLTDLSQNWDKDMWLLDYGLFTMNVGMLTQLVSFVIPVGFYQFYISTQYGYWFARSTLLHMNYVVDTAKFLRMPGDIAFGAGLVMIGYFVFLVSVKNKGEKQD